ncbi:MAG: hypothetical protein J7515_17355 [Caulobacter sp.]|nr:hypothetical protein [Caulobacter sp.]
MTDTASNEDARERETDKPRPDHCPPAEGAVGGPEPTPNLPPGRGGDTGAER